MARLLLGARWWSLRRSHLLRSPVSPSVERAPVLDGSGLLSNTWQLKPLCTSGANVAVEVAQDTVQNLESSCGRENIDVSEVLSDKTLNPNESLGDCSKTIGEAAPSDKYVLSSEELPFMHKKEVAGAFEQVEATNANRGAADQSLSSAGKPDLGKDTFENLKEVLSGHFNNNLKGDNGNQGKKAPKSFKLDIPSNLLGGNSDKTSPSKESWAELIGQSVTATNASHSSTGRAGHYSASSKLSSENDADDDFSDLDYPQEADEVQTNTTVSVAAQSSRSPTTKAPETLVYENILESLMKDSAISNNPTNAAPRKLKPYSKKLAWNSAQSSNAYSKPIDLNIFSSAGVPGAPSARSVDSSFISRVETPIKPSKDFSIMESGYKVCIDNLPSQIDLARIKESISIFGEVTGSFKKTGGKGLSACYIEFKTDEAKENALAGRWVYIDGQQYRITRAEQPFTTVVRIRNVSKNTPESKVLFTCESCGRVDKVTSRGVGVFDVYFKVTELANMPQILDSLNEVTLNQIRWKAQPAPRIHPDAKGTLFQTDEGLKWLTSQLNHALTKLESGINRASISIEDFRELHSLDKTAQVPGLVNSNSESVSPLVYENLGLIMKGLRKNSE